MKNTRSAALRVGVNGRFLAKPYTGIGQYTKHLFEAVARLASDLQIVMVVPEKVDVVMLGNVEIHVVPENLAFGSVGMKKTFWEQVQVPNFFKEQKVDLMHFPYPANPWKGRRADGDGVPVCVTVHDTIPWEDAAYRRKFLTRAYQNSARRAIKKADHIFTVSESSKTDILRLCGGAGGVSAEKISITYNAPAAHFSTKISPENRAKILQKYGINPHKKYFFYIGGYDARKNVDMLIEAFKSQIAPHYEFDLVLAGGKAVDDKLYESFNAAKTSSHDGPSTGPGKINVTGFIEEKDLPAFYQSAFAFVSVSKKEGCNVPLLEALCSGTPVITSDIAVHHEMVGDAVMYVDARHAAALGEMMKKIITDENFYHSQKTVVENYRCPFIWEAAAKNVLEVYQKFV